jgi:hypothetical protein
MSARGPATQSRDQYVRESDLRIVQTISVLDGKADIGMASIEVYLCDPEPTHADPSLARFARRSNVRKLRYTDRFDRYEETLDFGCAVLAAKLGLK